MKLTVSADGIALLDLVWHASLPVQLVLLLLLLASVVSWTMIFRKWFALRAANGAAERFETRFWSGANLSQTYTELSRREDTLGGMEGLFVEGFREFARLRQQPNIEPMDVLEGVQRAMRVALSREIDYLETHLSFLATVGSTSPYVGLLGTVWGIMNSFRSLGAVQQATVAHVAPGIAEALIATAIGLFAAIPAVIAYNRYSNNVERLVTRYEIFMQEFASVLQRQAFTARAESGIK
ncbi:MAG: protein TolQ [Candidatus Muproteobacteria bacterium RBG_16_65_31]|uniref:Tol-Pal system protein TolQ n=1 Tax=Candidatus Muproteobacteria bacterium RBG_16_65_31 TaxID=1817759 RepID=A0A1F6TFC9_9PROT|nr:MAG: protein TolQ [Candidatus Muproteobacteria bacterium RBG_16_65_31]